MLFVNVMVLSGRVVVNFFAIAQISQLASQHGLRYLAPDSASIGQEARECCRILTAGV